jgi:lysozyme
MNISPRLADVLLDEDIEKVEQDLRLLCGGIQFTQGMWDGLVSLCFNIGTNLKEKAPKMWLYLRAGEKEKAAAEFLDINKCKGRVLARLTQRRKEEHDLFLT